MYSIRTYHTTYRQEIFFAGAMPGVILPLARSMGCDMFNETLTAPQLTDPAFLKALKLYHRWVDELHLIPTAAEIASESTAQSSVNNASTPQLISGRYAMIVTGRYVNMDLRRFKTEPVNLSFSQYPEYDFKNLVFISRNTAIFKGSKHKDLAKIFLLFLASREYNELLIRSSDGLPPNPRWAENNPEYHHPAGRENEGNLHTNEPLGRHARGRAIRTVHLPLRLGTAQRPDEDRSESRGFIRRNVPYRKLRLSSSAASGPSANSRSATDKLGAKGSRSEKTWK